MPDRETIDAAMLLFSYGSNGPDQLQERLGCRVDGEPAHLPGWMRVFRGHSTRWNGGVATLERDPERVVYGWVCEVDREDLATLDRYEGVAQGVYHRVSLSVLVRRGPRDERVRAVAYVRARPAQEDPQASPSRAYRAAVARMVGAFWSNPDGSVVRPQDIDVEAPGNRSR